jgi:hypothetical protein
VERGLCQHCHTLPVTGRKRKFCDEHSRQASAIWKRKHPEWRTPWVTTHEKRRAYFRTYMRGYRRRKRTPKTEAPEGGAAAWTNSN